MKLALSLLLLIAVFALGWSVHAPEPSVEAARAQDKRSHDIDPQAEADWRAKTKHLSNRDIALAVYKGELSTTPAERLNQLKRLKSHRLQIDDNINRYYIVLAMSEDELLEAIDTLEGQKEFGGIRNILIKRWVELNREAAYARFLQNPDDDTNAAIARSVFHQWAREDLPSALQAVQQLSPEQQKSQMRSLIYGIMAQDPYKALELQQTYGDDGDYAYNNIFQSLTRKDPDSAFTLLSTLPYRPYKRALEGYFAVMKDQDLSLAFSQLPQIRNRDLESQISRTLYTEWFNREPDAALAAIAEEPHPEKMLQIWNLRSTEAERLIDWASNSLDGEQQDQIISGAINQLIRNDMEAAKAYIETMPYNNRYRNAMRQLIRAQLDEDPEGTIQRVQDMPNGQERRDYMSSIVNHLAQNDWDSAKDLFFKLDPETQKNCMYSFVNPAMEDGPAAIVSWLEESSAADESGDLKKSILQTWSQNDPWACFDYLGPKGFSELDKNNQRNYMSYFARQSPSDAAAWLENVDEERQPDMVDAVSDAWLDHDPYEASMWIAELPEGKARDRAYENLVNEIRRSDPAAAFDWATGIGDESMRENNARQVLTHWDDPELARETLAASDLSSEEIEKLMKYIKTP